MAKVKLGPQTLLYPMPAVLVGAIVDEKPNFMTAAWCAIASYGPPAVSVAIRKQRHTLKGIRDHGTFSINVPSTNLAKKVDYCGLHSGKSRDKSKTFTAFRGELKTAPLIEECPLNLECKVLHYLELGTHTLVVGQIIETFINENCLVDHKADALKVDPIIYSPGTTKYHRIGEEIGPAFELGKEVGRTEHSVCDEQGCETLTVEARRCRLNAARCLLSTSVRYSAQTVACFTKPWRVFLRRIRISQRGSPQNLRAFERNRATPSA